MDKVTAVFQYSGIKKIVTHNKMMKQKTFSTDILDILVTILEHHLRLITSPIPQTDFINLVEYHNDFGIMQGFDTLFNSFQLKTKICMSYRGIFVSHIMI